MITRISVPAFSNGLSTGKTTSFGMARLNDKGREIADSFGYDANAFLKPEMFKKQGVFKKSLLAQELAKRTDFLTLCQDYGCTKNPKTNADFIVNQVLSKKSKAALSNLDRDSLSEGVLALYHSNYDNPQLSTVHTRQLLDLLKDTLTPDEYVKNAGLLSIGTRN